MVFDKDGGAWVLERSDPGNLIWDDNNTQLFYLTYEQVCAIFYDGSLFDELRAAGSQEFHEDRDNPFNLSEYAIEAEPDPHEVTNET